MSRMQNSTYYDAFRDSSSRREVSVSEYFLSVFILFNDSVQIMRDVAVFVIYITRSNHMQDLVRLPEATVTKDL